MYVCGYDGYIVIVLGIVYYFVIYFENFSGIVKIIF